MLLDGAFTALLLIICGVSSQAVPPPTDLKVSCQNNQTTVNWDYSKDQPETIFRVNVSGSKHIRSFEANTTDHQYDLSHFVWESKEHYLGFLCVSVTAVQGSKQSEAKWSKSFSFNQLISVDIKCLLDFPPVEVDGTEKGATIKFKNPLSFYELKRTVQQENAILKYTVSSSVSSVERECSIADVFCKLDVKFPDDVECVTLKGILLFDQAATSQVNLKETEKCCSKTPAAVKMETALAVTLGFIFLIVLTVAVVLICKVEAWTTKTPNPQISGYACGKPKRQGYFTPKPEENSRVSILPPYKSTLTDFDDKFSEFEAKDGSGDDSCARESCPEGECFKEDMNYNTGKLMSEANGPHYYAENSSRGESCASESGLVGESYEKRDLDYETGGLLSDANGTDEDSTDDSMKTECISISSTDEERYPYDRPHVVQMDMGNGDLVIGYTGNENGL